MFLCAACGSGENSPVDQLVQQMDTATENVQNIGNISQLSNISNIVASNAIMKIIEENSDYKLTGSDKKTLKKSYDKMVEAAIAKSEEMISNPAIKRAAKEQLEMVREVMNKNIENAKTLGEIRDINY